MARGGERDLRKERFWRRMVEGWRRGRLNVRDYCKKRGLSEPSFYSWRRKIGAGGAVKLPAVGSVREKNGRREAPAGKAKGGDTKAAAFLPVRVVGAASAASFGSVIEVVLGNGRVLRAPVGFDAATLRQLLGILEEGPSC